MGGPYVIITPKSPGSSLKVCKVGSSSTDTDLPDSLNCWTVSSCLQGSYNIAPRLNDMYLFLFPQVLCSLKSIPVVSILVLIIPVIVFSNTK